MADCCCASVAGSLSNRSPPSVYLLIIRATIKEWWFPRRMITDAGSGATRSVCS